MDINRAASTEILANLLIDIDAYAQAIAGIDEHRNYNLGYEHYKSICDRIDDLSERIGTTFKDVLADKVRIEDELHADQARR